MNCATYMSQLPTGAQTGISLPNRVLYVAGGSLEEALDWLCIHIPNSELPVALRGKRGSTIQVVTKVNDAALKSEQGRLMLALGFSQADVASALKEFTSEAPNNAAACWGRLVAALTGLSLHAGDIPQLFAALQAEIAESLTEPSWSQPDESEEEHLSMWWNEQFAFISVYPDLVIHASENCFRMKVAVPEALASVYSTGAGQSADVSAELIIVFSKCCGDALPLIGLRCKELPPAVRLHYTQKVYQHLKEEYSSIEGALHAAFSFLEEQFMDVAPSLTEVRLRWGSLLQADKTNGSAAAAAANEPSNKQQQKAKPACPRVPKARVLSAKQLEAESARLQAEFQKARGSAKGQEMQAARDRLPAAAKKSIVLDAVEKHRVVVISGATGCGKSTQVCTRVTCMYIR